jgi:cytochrome bd-type quinol oxidase subunit 2
MLKNIRSLIVGLVSAITLVAAPVAVPAIASAATNNQIQSNLCAGATLKVDAGGDCSTTSDGTNQINSIITTIINVFSLVVGVVSVIMIILGGFRYITSGGDSSNVQSAKNTIIYALIGLVVVALAQFIVQFVLNKVTQTS